MIIPATYENLQVTHEGTMSKRAYYIPASTKRDDLVEHREPLIGSSCTTEIGSSNTIPMSTT